MAKKPATTKETTMSNDTTAPVAEKKKRVVGPRKAAELSVVAIIRDASGNIVNGASLQIVAVTKDAGAAFKLYKGTEGSDMFIVTQDKVSA